MSRPRGLAPLALLAAMTLLGGFLATAAPRTLRHLEDASLRESVTEAGASVRDLTVVTPLDNADLDELSRERDRIEARLPGSLRHLVDGRWYAVQTPAGTGISEAFPEFEGKPPLIDARVQDGFADAARLVSGSPPEVPEVPKGAAASGRDAKPLPVQAMLSEQTARALHVTVGDRFTINPHQSYVPSLRVTVSGIFRAKRPAAAIWRDHPQTLHPAIPKPFETDPPTYLATVLLHPGAIDALRAIRWRAEVTFRYRIDAHRLDARQAGPVRAGVHRLEAGAHGVPRGYLRTGLDRLVERYADRRAAVLAVVAVVVAGLLGAMLGVLLLAARLAVERRREELALLAARGGSIRRLCAGLAAQTALLAVPATLAGIGLGLLVPGAAGPPWLAIGIGLVAVLAVPGFAVPPLRRTGTAARQEAALLRPSLRRLTAEATVLLLAVLGVLLLRRRGVFGADGVDPYLSAVPVLLGLAAGLLALRLYPWPLRLAGRLAARLRGPVHFIGTARAGRVPPAAAFPLVVLVIASSVGVFSGVVRDTVAEARDRTAWQQVGSDVRVHGAGFDSRAARAVARVAGVRAVARALAVPATPLYRPDNASRDIGATTGYAVDGPAYRRVLAASGIPFRLPAALARDGADGGTLPAIASPKTAKLARTGQVRIGGQPYRYRVVGVLDTFPGLGSQPRGFLVVPLGSLSPDLNATELLLAGTGIDRRALASVAAEQQRRTVAKLSRRAAQRLDPPTLETRAQRRSEAERGRLNQALSLAYAAGTAGATGLALLAAGLAIVVSAGARRRLLARLRTLGLPRRAVPPLLAWETVPLLGVALLAGTALGAVLPRLVAPALGLGQFTGGAEPRIVLDALPVAGTFGLVALLVAVGTGIEAVRADTRGESR